MYNYHGYVWHATFQGSETDVDIFFGPTGRIIGQMHENIETNSFEIQRPNFLFYKNTRIMEKSREEIERRKFLLRLQKAYLRLDISASYEEAKTALSTKKDLIVIASNPDLRANHLIGKIVEGKPSWGVMPGAFMSYNGLTPFDDFFGAEYMAREGKRQGQCNTFIGQLRIEHKN